MAGPWEEWAHVRLSSWASGAGAVSSDSLSVVRGGGGGVGYYSSRAFSEGNVRTRKCSSLPAGDRSWVFPVARDSSGPDTLSVHVKHQVTLFTRFKFFFFLSYQ